MCVYVRLSVYVTVESIREPRILQHWNSRRLRAICRGAEDCAPVRQEHNVL